MKPSFLQIFVLAAVVSALPLPAIAQSPVRITLDQAIALALEHNHALKATRTLIDQNRAQEITANLRPNPVMIVDALFIPIFSPDQLTADNINMASEFDAGLSYLFERGKKRQHRLQAARDLSAVQISLVNDAERSLAFSVGQQFVNVLLAESNLELAQKDLQSFQQTVDISEARYKAGDISEGDYLKIKLQLLQFQTDVNAARLAKVQALVSLRELLGYESVPADYDAAGELAYAPLEKSAETLQAMALQDRPDLRAARQGVTAAKSQHALAQANGKVDVTGTFDYTHVSGFNSGSFTVNVPLPIFNRNQGEIARTNYAITQAQETETAVSETVAGDVKNAYEGVKANDQVVQLYRSGYLDQAQQSRDISEYAYKRGAASLLDFLDAERSYRATQLAYRQSLANYMVALEQLREAVGTRNLP
jgi:cobalt-zinc-cadmium efflux system outer membrane protein